MCVYLIYCSRDCIHLDKMGIIEEGADREGMENTLCADGRGLRSQIDPWKAVGGVDHELVGVLMKQPGLHAICSIHFSACELVRHNLILLKCSPYHCLQYSRGGLTRAL